MFWTGRPRRAEKLMATALETAPAGTARARLHSVQARSLALIGARQEVRAALNAAADELQGAGDDAFLDEIGGELCFDPARRALCAGTSFIVLGEGTQAETEAAVAVQLFSTVPEPDRWAAGELSAQVDLATARVMRGDLAGAQDALTAVFALDPERRTEAVARRLANLGHLLGAARYRNAGEAAGIGEAIEDFATRSLSRGATRVIFNPAG
jgi:hypothetical protein